ncbi:MAG: Hsp33 family molecular chaperone HslO [Peptoniphilaceae bacterium]|uniref:Hsp33 family molecular chaperone HslO n=1 Tax=Parvimonas sp. TaxID=1944660 RepID=UPI0025FD8810|nr:Hsp33 family molecular chaperone HslO [Parvimonas sp.]MCI5996954.1 Hsp33 family molecular chaperone HslO [Parvimonas sp.]MDD7765040.1 Hsp33 family molecular chaperone HslO [Peptoniphilaceae bacterium]MDY3050276.1 Hsp33 family molecular chaperone HslO [Parvimonas sp.]
MAKILRCIDEHNSMRFFFAFTDDVVREFKRVQKSSISSDIEMGKILTMNTLLYSDLKNNTDSIDIKLKTNGKCGLIISKLYNGSFVTGYLENKTLEKYDKIYKIGKVSKDFIGDKGIIVIIKDLGLKTPYIGQTNIISENLSENFSNYFTSSNQTLTNVHLDVKPFKNEYVSFGFMMELLPNYTEKDLSQFKIYSDMFKEELDNYINGNFKDVSFYDYICSILDIFKIRITEEKIIHYKCSCNDEKIDDMLLSLGKKELDDIINEGKDIEIACNFCDKKYVRTKEDIIRILKNL